MKALDSNGKFYQTEAAFICQRNERGLRIDWRKIQCDRD